MVVFSGYDPKTTNYLKTPSPSTSMGSWAALQNVGGGTGANDTRDTGHVWALPSGASLKFNSGTSPSALGYGVAIQVVTLPDPTSDYSFGGMFGNSQDPVVPYMRLHWYASVDGSGTALQQDALDPVFGVHDTSGWRKIAMEGITPPVGANSVKCEVGFICQTAGTGVGSVWADGLMFVKGSKLPTYIDGEQGANYHWTGTAYNSESYRDALALSIPQGKLGITKVVPQLFEADKAGNLGRDLTGYMIEANVEMRSDRTIRKMLHGTVSDPYQFKAFSQYIVPILTLNYSDGTIVSNKVGLYTLIPSEVEAKQAGLAGGFDAYDITWGLSETNFSFPYTVSIGSNIIGAVIGIANQEGYKTNIPYDSSKVATRPLTYDISWSKLKIMNKLLRAAGYYECWGDNNGYITSFPHIDWSIATPNKVLQSGPGSDVVNSIRRQPTYDSIYNRVRVIKEDTTNPVNAFVITLTNSNPNSPTSTVSLGRVRLADPVMDNDIPDSATGTLIAKKMLQEASSFYVRYEVSTLPDPMHDVHEFYQADVDQNDGLNILSGNYYVTGWDLPLNSRDPMVHYLNRVEVFQ